MIELHEGDIVRFKTDYRSHGMQHGDPVLQGTAGIVTVQSMSGLIVRYGDPHVAGLSLCVLYNDAPQVLKRLRKVTAADGDPLAFWSAHWQEYEPITRVLFRWWKGGEWDEPSLIALFPDECPSYTDPALCDSYQHIGQHGAARLSMIIRESRPATEAEYADLKRELESAPYGYNLRLMKRTPADSYQRRLDQMRAYRAASPQPG